jgi:hypothetical protein
MAGFEPAASCSQSRRANQAAPHPANRTVAYRPGTGAGAWRGQRRPDTLRGTPLRSVIPARYLYSDGAPVGGIPFSRVRGRSSMAEPQPSKLVMRVRFPSPAPPQIRRPGGVGGQDSRGLAAGGRQPGPRLSAGAHRRRPLPATPLPRTPPQPHSRRNAPYDTALRKLAGRRSAPGVPVARAKSPASSRNAANCPGRPPSVKGTRRSFLTAPRKRSSGPALERRRPPPTRRA